MRNRVLTMLLLLIPLFVAGQREYRTVEMRHVSGHAGANGETDFKGETAIFDTEQRMAFLRDYAAMLSGYFGDPELDRKPVPVDSAKRIAARIKPQPRPAVRSRHDLDRWSHIGYSPSKVERETGNRAYWTRYPFVSVNDGSLRFVSAGMAVREFNPVTWRGKCSMYVKRADAKNNFSVDLGGSITIRVDQDGTVSCNGTKTRGSISVGEWRRLEIDIDLDEAESGYNVYLDGDKIADYWPLNRTPVGRIGLTADKGVEFDEIVITGFGKKEFTAEDLHDRDEPFTLAILMDETFETTPSPEGFATREYDSAAWKTVDEFPFAYGGQRHEGETLYLRSEFTVAEGLGSGNRERAILNIESIFPAGEVWVNGRIVHLSRKPYPVQTDITQYLSAGRNVIGIVVYPNKVQVTNRHTAVDLHTGWHAGRAWIDYRSLDFIADPYVVTDQAAPDRAEITVNFVASSHRWRQNEREVKSHNRFRGSVEVSLFEWFPRESSAASSTATIPVEVELMQERVYSVKLTLDDPKLWSVETPRLYKVVLALSDEQGNPVDDLAFTTGIRTVSQDGGTFRINGRPAMMNGALLLGHRYPFEHISRWMYCAPSYVLVQDVMKIKAMNGNTIRMSHHDQQTGGTNDPRYAEIADQLGLMFQWATPAWVRSGSPWMLDFEGLPLYVKQVRNHPSIVMWQPANHPNVRHPMERIMSWFGKVYTSIYAQDSSRLISPTANQIRMNAPSDDGTLTFNGKPAKPYAVWTAPMITRGNMDHIAGYGAEWSGIRRWPDAVKWDGEQGWRASANRDTYLASKERAYFDFENEESIGQHNWNLQKGKPEYRIMSYEWDYDTGSVGRRLTTDEWRESQAYQALSAYEAIKKKRLLGYDGFAWCELNGGANSATYLKSLLDYYDHAKLSYYALGMVYQGSFACSDNVDIAYGRSDTCRAVIVHMGDQAKADLTVNIKDMAGRSVHVERFHDIALPSGRTVVEAGRVDISNLKEGNYTFEYTLRIHVDVPS